MILTKMTEQYYDWLYKIVCGEWEPRNLSFHRLLMFLYNRRYIPACEMDVCRATDVNDAIGFRMDPEMVLYYSENCFGTADAITFNDNLLRIHDLKTGAVPAHMEQLFIYAALFCMEYRINPKDIQFETRIYQNDDIWIENPTYEDIDPIIEKIREFDKVIADLKLGAVA